jgi:hypothetical protein
VSPELVPLTRSNADDYFNIQTCWSNAAGVLIRELDSLEASWPPMNTTALRNEIGTVLYAMNSLSARFPIVGKDSFSLPVSSRVVHRL